MCSEHGDRFLVSCVHMMMMVLICIFNFSIVSMPFGFMNSCFVFIVNVMYRSLAPFVCLLCDQHAVSLCILFLFLCDEIGFRSLLNAASHILGLSRMQILTS